MMHLLFFLCLKCTEMSMWGRADTKLQTISLFRELIVSLVGNGVSRMSVRLMQAVNLNLKIFQISIF